jgi:dihydrofolate reductase/thymidylate synthase
MRSQVPFRYMVCTDRNGVIGVRNTLPFRVPLDMARFRSSTEHPEHPKKTNGVLMGYQTWKSLPEAHRPLPNRLNMVLTTSPDHASEVRAKGAYPFSHVSHVFDFADSLNTTVAAVYVIGGGKLYKNQTLRSRAHTIHWTMVDADVPLASSVDPADVVRFQVTKHFRLQDFEEVDSWKTVTAVTFMTPVEQPEAGEQQQLPVVFRTYRRTEDHNTDAATAAISSSRPAQSVVERASPVVPMATLNPRFSSGEVQYLQLLRKVLETGERRTTRNSVTRSLFGERIVVDLSDGKVPLLTSKKMAWKTVLKELFWFVRGDTDNTKLQAQKVHIWDANASREFLDSRGLTKRQTNDLGPVYGFQWRHFGADYMDCHTDYTGHGVDQLEECRRLIVEEPQSRRILFTAWNPSALPEMALPPCHLLGQWYVKEDGKLWLQVYQRSGDLFLGVPFNLFSYSAMVHMMAHLTDKQPGGLVHVIGDAHIYETHEAAVRTQLKRATHTPPTFRITDEEGTIKTWEAFDMNTVSLTGYVCEESLRAPMVA